MLSDREWLLLAAAGNEGGGRGPEGGAPPVVHGDGGGGAPEASTSTSQAASGGGSAMGGGGGSSGGSELPDWGLGGSDGLGCDARNRVLRPECAIAAEQLPECGCLRTLICFSPTTRIVGCKPAGVPTGNYWCCPPLEL